MGLRNTKSHYGKMSIILHWIMALLIIGIIAVGFYMGTLEDGDPKWQLYSYHKATGVLILVLALFRWFWVLTNEKLAPPTTFTKKDIGLAHASKWSLMLMMLVMPVSGLTMSIAAGKSVNFFGLFTIPALEEANRSVAGIFHEVHELSAWAIAILVGLHILFALKHHWINKDETLLRILGRN